MTPKPVMSRHVSSSCFTALARPDIDFLCAAGACARQRWPHRGDQSASSMQPLSPLLRAAQRGEVEELRRLVQEVAKIFATSGSVTITRRIAIDMHDELQQ